MELTSVKGLGSATIQKLQNAGVQTVEQLALMDTKIQEVQGLTRDRLGQLRREAQKTIFRRARGAVVGAGRAAAATTKRQAAAVERLARDSAVQALDAAKRAEEFAVQALSAAESRAAELAATAANQASVARDAVRESWMRVNRKIQELRQPAEPVVDRYIALMRRAEDAAHDAAGRALEAARMARETGAVWANRTTDAGRSLYRRLLEKMGRQNGH